MKNNLKDSLEIELGKITRNRDYLKVQLHIYSIPLGLSFKVTLNIIVNPALFTYKYLTSISPDITKVL